MINSSTDLSHHRTYRSVYGGSLGRWLKDIIKIGAENKDERKLIFTIEKENS